MELTPFCLMLSCLQVHPDRSQFFRYDTINLTCKDQHNLTGWTVKRETPSGGTRRCGAGWGSATSGSTCIIGATYPSDSGVYWCESAHGEQSNGVNITITDRTVILESPALSVSQGAMMTLRCKAETNSTNHIYDFYKNGDHLTSSAEGELTIHSALKSDEGLYMCSIHRGAKSISSWVAVYASNYTSPPPASSCLFSVFRLICYAVVATLYLISTILLGLIHRNRKRAQTVPERGSNSVIMEIAV